MNTDELFIKQTLKLAKKGLGWTNPNPMVGAVIVKNGRVIGKGFHHQAGKDHAEIEALKKVTEDPKGATLYVNLEPCASFGKTPPCVDVIIKSKIKKVVCSTLDPNPKNHGKSIAKLQKSGIETSVGILENEAKILNEAFFTFHIKKRPFVAIKFASSLDGKIATHTGDSKWITNEQARAYARFLRSCYQAVLVGIHTVAADNPNLGARIKGKKDPIRVIIDPRLQISLDSQVLHDANAMIITTTKADKIKKEKLEEKGITILTFDNKHITISNLLSLLRKKDIISVLVEGGGETLGNFIDNKTVDKVYAFHAPIIVGGIHAVTIGGEGTQTIKESLHLKNVSFKKFGDNLLTTGYTI